MFCYRFLQNNDVYYQHDANMMHGKKLDWVIKCIKIENFDGICKTWMIR